MTHYCMANPELYATMERTVLPQLIFFNLEPTVLKLIKLSKICTYPLSSQNFVVFYLPSFLPLNQGCGAGAAPFWPNGSRISAIAASPALDQA